MEFRGIIDQGQWMEIVKADPDATFFQTPYFADILLSDEKIDTAYALGWSDDDVEIALPIFKREHVHVPGTSQSVVDEIASSGAGTYGGFIATGEGFDLEGLYKSLIGYRPTLAFKLKFIENPFSRDLNGLSHHFDYTEDFTQAIRLDRSYGDIYEGFRGGRQRNIETAKSKGVTVRRAESKSDVERYYDCYQKSLERWDDVTSVYGKPLFNRVWELSKAIDEVGIWVAEVNGEIASGAIIFEWNGHVDYWHGAADSDYFDDRPNDILHAQIMQDAVERGQEIYDFNPSGGHDGVVGFKKGFGPERLSFRRYEYSNKYFDLLESVKGKANAVLSS